MSYFKAIGRPATAIRASVVDGLKLYYASNLSVAVQPSSSVYARPPAATFVKYASQDYASVSAQSDLVIVTPHHPLILSLHKEQWSFVQQPYSWASRSDDADPAKAEQVVLGAAGGIYQVDVPSGGSLVAEPMCIVAYTGSRPISRHTDTRFDTVYAFASQASQRLSQGARELVSGTKRSQAMLAKLLDFAKRLGPKKTSPDSAPLQEAIPQERQAQAATGDSPSSTQVFDTAKQWLRTVSGYTAQALTAVERKFSRLTRRKQFVFQGPCTVLVQGASHT